jgi:hypothetical protein
MAGLKETLCNIYDARPFRREKMKPKARKGEEPQAEEWRFDVRQPFLSMAVGTTAERFFEVARVADLHSGFLPRFALVVPPETPGAPRPLGEFTETLQEQRDAVVARLQALRAGTINLRADSEVLPRFNQYVAAVEAESRSAPNPNLVAIVGSRVTWMALHVAMLLAVADGTQRFALPHLLRGIKIAEGWRHTAIQTLGALTPSQFERRAARVVQLVTQKGEISRRDVMRALHISKRDMDDLQATVNERGELLVETRQTSTGSSIWFRAPQAVTVSQVSPRGFSTTIPPTSTQPSTNGTEEGEWTA